MFKFIIGAVLGAGVVYAALVYPVQSKAALATAATAAEQGANSVASTISTATAPAKK